MFSNPDEDAKYVNDPYYPIIRAVRLLADADLDDASEQNGIGYNKIDGAFGKSLARKPWSSWTPKMKQAAYGMIRRYREQLRNYFGIDYEKIANPVALTTGRQVDPGLQQAREADSTQQRGSSFQRPDAPPPYKWISLSEDGELIEIEFKNCTKEEFTDIHTAVKAMSGARFQTIGGEENPLYQQQKRDNPYAKRWLRNPDRSYWTVPLNTTTAIQVNQMAREFKFRATPEVIARVKQMAEQASKMEEVSKMVADDFDVPGFGNPEKGLAPLPFQRAGMRYVIEGTKQALIADDMGLGKLQPVDAKVLTPVGWQEIGTILPGHMVIGSNGEPTEVTGVYPQGVQPIYRVTFSDGSSVEAGPDHLWTMRYWVGGRHMGEIVLTTDQLLHRPVIEQRRGNRVTQLDLSKVTLYLPMLSAPAMFYPQLETLPIPPYTMGYLLANGSLMDSSIRVTTHCDDLESVRNSIQLEGVNCNCVTASTISKSRYFLLPGMVEKIRKLKLQVGSKDKFIPTNYLRALPHDRIALLQGLMDGDGSISQTNNRLTYHTISKELANNVQELVECLGGIASVKSYDRSHEGKPVEYTVRIRLPRSILPFRVPRKASRYEPGKLASPARSVRSVEYVRDVESVCISVDAPDQLYATEHAILTHNTIQALGILFGLKAYPALIVVPKVVLINWKREILKWCPGVKPIIVNSRVTAEEIQQEEPDVVLINYDILKAAYPQLAMIQWAAVVADEAHRAKNPGAQRTQALKAIAKDVTIRLLLTGTPIENRPPELISLLEILGVFKRMWKTKEEFYSNHWWNSTLQNPMALHNQLRQTCMVRRKKEDVLKELPPIRRTMVPVVLDNEKEYDYAEKNLLSWVAKEAAKDEAFLATVAHLPEMERQAAIRAYQNDKVARARRALALVRIEKLKQLSVRGKYKQFLEWLDGEMEDDDKKMVIMATHRDVQAKLKRHYANAATIFGGMKGELRQAEQDRFMTDPACREAICAMKAAGEGITLTSAHHGVFIEFGWTPTGHAQAEARIHRIGQEYPVNWYYFCGVRENGEPTIDEWIFELIDKKAAIAKSIIDGEEPDENESLGTMLWNKLKERAKEVNNLPENPVFDDEQDEEMEVLEGETV